MSEIEIIRRFATKDKTMIEVSMRPSDKRISLSLSDDVESTVQTELTTNELKKLIKKLQDIEFLIDNSEFDQFNEIKFAIVDSFYEVFRHFTDNKSKCVFLNCKEQDYEKVTNIQQALKILNINIRCEAYYKGVNNTSPSFIGYNFRLI